MNVRSHVGFKCSLEVIRGGEIVSTLPEQRNLLLDTGLAKVFSVSTMSGYGNWGHYGDSDAPNQRDSGTLVFTRSGNVVTCDGAFFEATDVGRLLKFDSGEEMYISAFTSSTVVETADSGDILTPSEGTVWYVNRTTLDSPIKRKSAGSASSSYSAGVYKRIWVYDFAAETALQTVREVGFSDVDSNADLCSRVVLASPVVLQIGDQLRLTAYLELTASPNTPAAYDPTSGLSEESGAGQGQFEYASTDAAWNTIWPGYPFGAQKKLVPLDGDPLPFESYGTGRVFNGAGLIPNSYNTEADSITVGANPTLFPFQRSTVHTWSPARISGTFYGFVMLQTAFVGSEQNYTTDPGWGRFVWAFNAPAPKTSSQSMSVTITESVDRNLVN